MQRLRKQLHRRGRSRGSRPDVAGGVEQSDEIIGHEVRGGFASQVSTTDGVVAVDASGRCKGNDFPSVSEGGTQSGADKGIGGV